MEAIQILSTEKDSVLYHVPIVFTVLRSLTSSENTANIYEDTFLIPPCSPRLRPALCMPASNTRKIHLLLLTLFYGFAPACNSKWMSGWLWWVRAASNAVWLNRDRWLMSAW